MARPSLPEKEVRPERYPESRLHKIRLSGHPGSPRVRRRFRLIAVTGIGSDKIYLIFAPWRGCRAFSYRETPKPQKRERKVAKEIFLYPASCTRPAPNAVPPEGRNFLKPLTIAGC